MSTSFSKSDQTSKHGPANSSLGWTNPSRICFKMPNRRPNNDKPVDFNSSVGKEQLYNSRVLLGNWFEERRMYHQLCSRCTGHSIYHTDYLPYCKEDYTQENCVPPTKYEAINFDEGEGWKLLRNSEDYCDYLSNYTTTYDLMHNWEVRRAGCKPKPRRKWRIVRGLWLPEIDNALPYGNLTQISFRKGPILPPVPNDWKTYDMDTEYSQRFHSHKYPESYTLCRYAPSKQVRRELADWTLVNKPGHCSGPHADPQRNVETCCPSKCGDQNPKRFSDKCFLSNLLPNKPLQTLFASTKDPYMSVKHPPHTLPFYSRPQFNSSHSCDDRDDCALGQMVQDVSQCCS